MHFLRFLLLAGAVCLLGGSVLGQANLPIYTDRRVNGFEDWSWGARTFNNTSPVRSGTMSISVSNAVGEALSLFHPDFDTSPYASLSFWVHGGSGGQVLRVQALLSLVAQPGTNLPALPANTWTQFVIPLTALNAANKTNFDRFWIQRVSGSAPFYLDDIQLTAKPAPAQVNLSVNATSTVRTADARWFGVNTAIWDSSFDTPTTIAALQDMGSLILRYPGGSRSDDYHWASNRTSTDNIFWGTHFARYVHVATNVAAQSFITVNYGTSQTGTRGGQPLEAAAWVAYANGDASLYGTTNDITLGLDEDGFNWRTVGYWARLRTLTSAANPDNQYDFLALGRSAPLQIKYWEIGNENYGPWELDRHTLTNHAYTYAVQATNFIAQMKRVDPTIKVGIVGTPGESSYDNGYTDHPVVNPRTGQTRYGWTPIVLASLKSFGVTPDFLVHHVYPEYTGGESDPLLLQSASNWARDAADLRQQITDFFGTGGANIELVCTENNANSGALGRQSTSLVNGLYYADSLARLAKTEFNALVWWDLRNGSDMSGSFDPTIYGWRNYGDHGMINGLSTLHPTFYAARMMRRFIGSSIINASSDYLLLSVYASRTQNGGLNLLVLNKDSVANFNSQISINGFTPSSNAIVYSYGITQDEAARTNAPASARDIAQSNFAAAAATFSYSFPPLSLTVFQLAPARPRLLVLQSQGPLVLQLQGEPGARYVIDSISNLGTSFPLAWIKRATNTLTNTTVNITNPGPAGAPVQFYRAVWTPSVGTYITQ